MTEERREQELSESAKGEREEAGEDTGSAAVEESVEAEEETGGALSGDKEKKGDDPK